MFKMERSYMAYAQSGLEYQFYYYIRRECLKIDCSIREPLPRREG
jgi:hypothetical protein